jgi:hypothetical protein
VALLGVCLVSFTVTANAGAPEYTWLDVEGKPLPYQDSDAIEEALLTARVVEKRQIGRGVAGALKLVLENEGTTFHGVFRMVDVSKREKTGSARMVIKYRDAAVFEKAAYEISEMLGIHRVPPTVVRNIDGYDGTVQIWMEGTDAEDELLESGPIDPPDVGRWRRQKAIMDVFDSLIANVDRNQGNILIDERWNLWFIDHTRAFRRTSKLVEIDDIHSCERELWDALRDTDTHTYRARLEPFLESREIGKLQLRHKKLVKHINKLIEKHGADRVLFDLE